MDDGELNDRFRAGDDAALRLVYDRYGRAMYAVALSILRDRELAADCVQEALVKAWRASQTFDPARELKPWLATITRRVAIDIYRRQASTRRTELRDDVDAPVIPIAFERTWEAFEIRSALDQLPEDEREIVRLAHERTRSGRDLRPLPDADPRPPRVRCRDGCRRVKERAA